MQILESTLKTVVKIHRSVVGSECDQYQIPDICMQIFSEEDYDPAARLTKRSAGQNYSVGHLWYGNL